MLIPTQFKRAHQGTYALCHSVGRICDYDNCIVFLQFINICCPRMVIQTCQLIPRMKRIFFLCAYCNGTSCCRVKSNFLPCASS